jgi:hypothetical protein
MESEFEDPVALAEHIALAQEAYDRCVFRLVRSVEDLDLSGDRIDEKNPVSGQHKGTDQRASR